jgi:hypothetical protein
MRVFMVISMVRPYNVNCAGFCQHGAYRSALTMTLVLVLVRTRNEAGLDYV